jgi:hypothetical protein
VLGVATTAAAVMAAAVAAVAAWAVDSNAAATNKKAPAKGGDRGQSDSSPHAAVADVRVNLEDEHLQPLPASWRALGNTAATSKNAAATREQGFQKVKDTAMLALRRRYPEAFSANRILPKGRARWCASWLNPSIRNGRRNAYRRLRAWGLSWAGCQRPVRNSERVTVAPRVGCQRGFS